MRGKHAAQADRRRHDAAAALVEQLAQKNAELKKRVSAVEDDAARVPALLRRIADLEEQLLSLETPRVARMREDHAAEVGHLEALVRCAVGFVNHLCRVIERPEAEDRTLPADITSQHGEPAELRAKWGLTVFPNGNRDWRRYAQTKSAWAGAAVDGRITRGSVSDGFQSPGLTHHHIARSNVRSGGQQS